MPTGRDLRLTRVCRHCGRKANRPRGLCWPCYYKPGVKELYAAGSVNPDRPYSARQGLDYAAAPVPAACPTAAAAGTLEKMRVMRRRLTRGELLHHPGDNREVRAEYPFETRGRERVAEQMADDPLAAAD